MRGLRRRVTGGIGFRPSHAVTRLPSVIVDTAPSYTASLAALTDKHPQIAAALRVAEQRRADRLAMYLDGARLRGLEQLYTYLNAAAEAFSDSPTLAPLRFLVDRVRADYVTALEATLSGYQGVAADAMRDVMEVECLLLDFAAHPDNAQEWLQSDEAVRRRKYMPVKVRERLQSAGVPPFADDDFEPVDYKCHSESLHVNPGQARLSTRGPDPDDDRIPFYNDLGFIEMFEHGHRALVAIELLRFSASDQSPHDFAPLMDRDAFDDAYARTHQMQIMMTAMVMGPQILRERLGREPTLAEQLTYIKDEVAQKSRPFGPSEPAHD